MYKNIPEYLNYGVEMEMTFPLGTTYQAPVPWNFHRDASIQCDIANRCETIELVSPILNGERGIKQVLGALEQVKGKGASVNTSTGFHVHVSIAKRAYLLEDLKRICHNFIKYEHAIDLIMAPSRLNNRFCQSNRALLPKDNVEAKQLIYNCTTIQQLQVVMCRNDRYYKLNLMALNKHGTIEFRQHMGTLNAGQIEGWVRFLLWFISNSVMQTRSLALLNDRTCEFSFEAMFKFVIKDEQLRNFYLKRKNEITSSNNGKKSCTCGC